MVRRYYVISSRWSSHFWVKMHVFSTFSTTKVKLVDDSSYLCVILHVKHKKILFIAILTWVLILGKIEDGDHCWWRHLPSAECGYEFTCSLRVTLLIKSSDGRKNQKRNHLINLPIFYWLHWNDREECSRGLVLSGTVLLKNIMFFTIIALHVQLYFVRVVGCIAL